MTTELSFLIELLLKHRLPATTKDLVAQRIKEVEEHLDSRMHVQMPARPLPPQVAMQSPSTQALMIKHGTAGDMVPHMPPPAPEPVAIVAQTPATAAAMAERQNLIASAMAGKGPQKQRQGPGFK